MLATIGRAKAVAQFGSIRVRFGGLVALVHPCISFSDPDFTIASRVVSEWIWYFPDLQTRRSFHRSASKIGITPDCSR